MDCILLYTELLCELDRQHNIKINLIVTYFKRIYYELLKPNIQHDEVVNYILTVTPVLERIILINNINQFLIYKF
jgi:hypothetical protein